VQEELVVFCDGGARGNPGPGAAGCVIKDEAGNPRFLCGKYLGVVTNNQAEYAAVKLALETAKKHFRTVRAIKFFLDSKLVVNQLAGFYKVKNPLLREVIFQIRQLESCFGEVYYQHVSREENSEADTLVNRVLDEERDFQQELT
jgi:ribonuclease HI